MAKPRNAGPTVRLARLTDTNAAPVIVLTARVVEGFALGGEVGPTTAFLIEASPPLRRGFFGAWQYASQCLANLVAGAIGLALSSALSASRRFWPKGKPPTPPKSIRRP